MLFAFVNFPPSIYAGNGLDVDEYVRKAYKFAYSDCIEVGPVACLPEPPDPNELYPRQSSRQALMFFFIICIRLLDNLWGMQFSSLTFFINKCL